MARQSTTRAAGRNRVAVAGSGSGSSSSSTVAVTEGARVHLTSPVVSVRPLSLWGVGLGSRLSHRWSGPRRGASRWSGCTSPWWHSWRHARRQKMHCSIMMFQIPTPSSLAHAIIEGSLTSPHSRTGLREQSVSGDHALVAALLVFKDSTREHTNRLCSRLSRNDCRRTTTRSESSVWPHATLGGRSAPTTASLYTLQTCSGSSSRERE